MKGQSALVGAVVLVLVFVAITGSVYLFVQKTSKTVSEAGREEVERTAKETEAALAISHVYTSDRKVEVQNIGRTPLSNKTFVAYLNNSKISITGSNCPESINSMKICNFTFSQSLDSGILELRAEYDTWDQINLTKIS